MRGIFIILSIIVLALATGGGVVFGGDYIATLLPRAHVGHAVTIAGAPPPTPISETGADANETGVDEQDAAPAPASAVSQTTETTYVPIVLHPNGDASLSQYTLDFGAPIERSMIVTNDEGLALVPAKQGADYTGPAARYRIVLTRKLARQDEIVLVAKIEDPRMASRISIYPDSGLLGKAVADMAVSPAVLQKAIAGGIVAAAAFGALIVLWIIVAITGLSSGPALSPADRKSSPPAKAPPASDGNAKQYKAERDFWRDAVRQFLTDRRVEVGEADRMLDSIEANLKGTGASGSKAAVRPLVASREG